MPDFNRLCKHRRNNREKPGGAFVIAISLVFQIDAQHTDRFSVYEYRDTDETQLLRFQRLFSYPQTIEKQRLATNLGDDYWFAGLCDAASYSFTNLILDPAGPVFVQTM